MKELRTYLDRNNIYYDEEMMRKFDAYRGGILQWNEFVNLTAIRDPEEFTLKHFVDSVTCVKLPEYEAAEKIIDMGTGAGFPGVPLAILSPEKQFVLVDSLNKRLRIIAELCQQIGIRNVTTIHARAEELGHAKEHREQYQLCVSRAVAPLGVLLEYCLPLLKKGGALAAYKGAEAENELAGAKRAMQLLGAEKCRIEETPLGEEGREHRLLVITKTKPTPSKYPRKAGTPAKEPLK